MLGLIGRGIRKNWFDREVTGVSKHATHVNLKKKRKPRAIKNECARYADGYQSSKHFKENLLPYDGVLKSKAKRHVRAWGRGEK